VVLPGSKAFTQIKDLPLSYKMEPRAQISYLVRYEAWNIFRIWNPKNGTVTCYCNILFDKSKYYNPRVLFHKDLLKEAVKPPTFTIEVPPPKQHIINNVKPEYQIKELDDNIEPPEDNNVEVIP
jgi:hypothetical protein